MSLDSGISLKELAHEIGADLQGDPDKEVLGLNTLDLASSDEVAFISREAYVSSLSSTNAGALICSKDLSEGFVGNKLIGEEAVTTSLDDERAKEVADTTPTETTQKVEKKPTTNPLKLFGIDEKAKTKVLQKILLT